MSGSSNWSDQLHAVLNSTEENMARNKVTEALRHAVQSLLKDREQQMCKISGLEGQHQELLVKQMAEGHQVQARSWKMLEYLQTDQKGKVHTLEVTRTETQDAQEEEPNLLRTSVHAQQSKLPPATTFGMSLSSSSSEVSLPDCDKLQSNVLSNLEPNSSQFHALEQEDLFLQGPKMFQSDL